MALTILSLFVFKYISWLTAQFPAYGVLQFNLPNTDTMACLHYCKKLKRLNRF